MVKKIRVIENGTADTSTSLTMSDADFRVNIMELAKSADWKLWEMLQVLQRLEKKINSIDITDDGK
jgi:hypothetical protein|tara:strand:+ start:7620 stop:7817 length:198 start_codon:yes stop_codon:yes gene_type:complete